MRAALLLAALIFTGATANVGHVTIHTPASTGTTVNPCTATRHINPDIGDCRDGQFIPS
jgi:hypothetical protein